jgi:predicted AAA+ superfamily ATPase
MIENDVLQSIAQNPVTAIVGTRQCGKTTLAKHIAGKSFL